MTGEKEKTPSSAEITRMLLEWNAGSEQALDELVPVVHRELKRIAARYMRAERINHSLQASALVNEAYLKLIDTRRVRWQDRAHFFAVSARLMRRILVDFARRNRFQKRGGGAARVSLDEGVIAAASRTGDVAALDDALTALAESHLRASQVVELRFFGGLTQEETAEVLKVSPDTVLRDWRFAKAWLHRELTREEER